MKNLIQYRWSVELALFEYTKNENLDLLISELKKVENHYKDVNQITDPDIGLWLRFEDDTLAWTINDIKNTLSLPENNMNRKHLMETIDMLFLFLTFDVKVYIS